MSAATALPGPGDGRARPRVPRIEAFDLRRRRDERAGDAPEGEPRPRVAGDDDAVRRDPVLGEQVARLHAPSVGRAELPRRFVDSHLGLGEPAGGRSADEVDGPDLAVEELVLVDDETVGDASPDDRRGCAVRKCAVDPVALADAHARKERPGRGPLDAALAAPDVVSDRCEEEERRHREHEREASRNEQEERRRDRAPDQDRGVDRVERQRAEGGPDRQQGERVRDRSRLDESLPRDRQGKQRRTDGDGRRQPERPGQAAVDQDEERDQEEGSDDEDVPLLDPVGELGRERGDDEQNRRGEGDPRGEERGDRLVQPAREQREQDEGRKGQHAEVEVELGQVVEEEASDRLGVVGALSDDRVGAEQVGERLTAGDLHSPAGARRRRREGRTAAESSRASLGGAAGRAGRGETARRRSQARRRSPAPASRRERRRERSDRPVVPASVARARARAAAHP